MFIKRFTAILAIVIMCTATTGCSVTNFTSTWWQSSSTPTLEENLANLPHPFVVAYGLNGASSMLLFKPTDSSNDKLANISLILMEPGFVAMINTEFCKNGMHTKLENLFKKEGFHLIGTETFKYQENKYILKMFFVKNGMDGRLFFK